MKIKKKGEKRRRKSLLEAVIKKGERKTLFLPIQVQVLIQVQAQVRMMIRTVKKKIVMNPHQEMKILEEGNQIKEKRRKNKLRLSCAKLRRSWG